MFFRFVIPVFAATLCTAPPIDVSDKQFAWERSGKFEGDIMLTEEQRTMLVNAGIRLPDEVVPFVTDDVFNVSDMQSTWEQSGKFEEDIMLPDKNMRHILIDTTFRWPNKTVPFVIDDVFNYFERIMIIRAMVDFHQNTPIRFRQYDPLNDTDYVHITGEDDGCWSYVGRVGGRQELNLQRGEIGCIWHGIIIHELLHALGFLHQHSATDRDNYVRIIWQNIEPGMEINFDSYPASIISSFGVPYDFGSVMHYDSFAFSRNGQPTIVPRGRNVQMGQTDGFSRRDIQKVQRMYSDTPFVTGESSSYATPSQFITLIIITLHTLTHLQ